MFTLDANYVHDPIEIGEFGNGEDDASDMNEIDIVMYTEERKLRLKEIVEVRKNRPKPFGAMWIQLSEESRNRIMDLQNYEKGDDPLTLWLAIKETHMTEGASTPTTLLQLPTLLRSSDCSLKLSSSHQLLHYYKTS
jgi:hypothetical protein